MQKKQRVKAFRFLTLESGCQVCISHHRTSHGYFFVSIDGVRDYLHRLIFVWTKGPIPNGFEVHHVCENRACCNPQHLEALSKHVHRAVTMDSRFGHLKNKAYQLLELSGGSITRKNLALALGVKVNSTDKYIKKWKSECMI